MEPVSYTHLDVYKRQNLRRLQQLAEMSGLQVKLQPMGGSVAGEIGHLFEQDVYKRQVQPHSRALAVWAKNACVLL